MDLCNLSVIRDLMRDAGITFRKEFGQNFLIDRRVPEAIADACTDRAESMILEIGPGVGCLTQELALRYRRVVAVEIDRGLIPVLEKTMAEYDNVRIVNDDVMKTDLGALIAAESGGLPVSVCANLPYYITTPILMRLLESGIPFESVTVMVQKEVADRLAAAPGSPDYGAITAIIGYYGSVRKLFRVPGGCFTPAPKVDSAVVRIDLYREKPVCPKDEALFRGVIAGAFEMRRKTLCNALGAKFPRFTKEEIAGAIRAIGREPTVRGECLSTAEFVALADALTKEADALTKEADALTKE